MLSRFRKYRRSLQLSLLARQTPDSLRKLSSRRLEKAYARALKQSRGYCQLLREAGVASEEKLSCEQILNSVPVLQKPDLFERVPIAELLRPGTQTDSLASILTSSGYGGGKFAFGISTRGQVRHVPDDIDLGLELAFGIDSRSTLLVNCLPMGVVFSSRAVCVANVSVREDMALAILQQAGPLFEQVILCVDPLFCKRLLDYSAEQGFDWSQLRVNMIIGEEMFSEDFRSYLAARVSASIDEPGGPLIGSSMGVGELGLNLFFETAETIALRRSLHRADPDRVLPSFFCYNPLRTYVEVLDPDADGVGDLVISMLESGAPVPMLRYRTGDRARWLTESDSAQLRGPARMALKQLPFPTIAVLGRDRDGVDAAWRVDHFKALIYRNPGIAEQLSGAFCVHRDAQGLQLDVQLKLGSEKRPEALCAELTSILLASATARSVTPPEVRCFSYADFPHGMGLDYERKFRYFPN